MNAFNPRLAAAIAAKGVPLSADWASTDAEWEPDTLAERTACSLRLEADVKAIVARQRCQVLAEAAKRTASPSDQIAYALDAWLITHPDEVEKAADAYPDWPAQFAAIKAAHTTALETP